jgi:hypothetical protein
MSVFVAVSVKCRFEFDMAVLTETQNSPVCDVADKKKAKKHCKALFT